jgi:hypothetical protein
MVKVELAAPIEGRKLAASQLGLNGDGDESWREAYRSRLVGVPSIGMSFQM